MYGVLVSTPSQQNSSSNGQQPPSSAQTTISTTPTLALALLASKLRKPSTSALHALKHRHEHADSSFERSTEAAATPGVTMETGLHSAPGNHSGHYRQASSSTPHSASRRLPFRDLLHLHSGNDDAAQMSASHNGHAASQDAYSDAAATLSHNTSLSSRKSRGHLRARSNSSSSKRADPPAPLDFSPPRPSWITSGEEHPAISRYQQEALHQHASIAAAHENQQLQFDPAKIEQSESLGSIYSDYSSADAHNSPTAHLSVAGGRTRYATSSAAQHDASNYSGLGLGLPFHAGPAKSAPTSPRISSERSDSTYQHALPQGAVAHVSQSPQIPSSSRASADHSVRLASHDSTQTYRLPRDTSSSAYSLASMAGATVDASRSPDAMYSPERSPVTDRRGLVGLGELATPRWTAMGDDRRWGQHPLPARNFSQGQQLYKDSQVAIAEGNAEAQPRESEDWQGELLGGYDDDEVRALPGGVRH